MENVQPLKLGKVFSYSFKLLGKDFWKMFWTNAVCMFIILIPVAVMLVSVFLDPARIFTGIDARSFKPENPFGFFLRPEILIPYILVFVFAYLVSPFMQGIPLVLSASRLYGRPLKFKEAFLKTGQKYGRLIATALADFLLVLPLLALYFWAYFGVYGSMFSSMYAFDTRAIGSTLMMVPLMFLFSIVYTAAMIYLGLVLNFSVCVTVNEEKYAFPAIWRSFYLVGKSGFWRNIGHYVVMMLAITGAAMVAGIFASIFMVSLVFSPVLVLASGILTALIILAFSSAIQSFMMVYMQLMYFNARIIKEGFGF